MQRVLQHCQTAFTGPPVLSHLTSSCFCPCPHLPTSKRPLKVCSHNLVPRGGQRLSKCRACFIYLIYRRKPIPLVPNAVAHPHEKEWAGTVLPSNTDTSSNTSQRRPVMEISPIPARERKFGPHRAVWGLFRQIYSLFNLRVVEKCESYTS